MVPRQGIALLVLLALVAAAVPVAATSVDRPWWRAGDFWTYRTNTTIVPGLNLTGTATSSVLGTIPILSDGSTVEAARVVLSGSGTAGGTVTTTSGPISVHGDWILTGEERFEPVNLHPLYSLLDLSVNGTYGGLLPFSLRFQNTTTYQVLSDGWPYPMVVGTSGNITVAYNFTQDLYSSILGDLHDNGTGHAVFGFSLAEAVSVGTPSGAFQAFPLREEAPDGTWQRLYFSTAVGNHVRMETYDQGGNLTAVSTLLAYRYQAAEPPTFLGLTLLAWAVVAPIVAAVLTAVVLLIRRARRKKSARFPGQGETGDPTSGPRGP